MADNLTSNNQASDEPQSLVEDLIKSVRDEDISLLELEIARQQKRRPSKEVLADALAASCLHGKALVVEHLLVSKAANANVASSRVKDAELVPPLVLAVKKCSRIASGPSNLAPQAVTGVNTAETLSAGGSPTKTSSTSNERLAIVKLLLDGGARVQQDDSDKRNAFFYVTQTQVAQLLLGADLQDVQKALNSTDSAGYNPLLCLLGTEVESDVPALLIKSGASIRAIDQKRRTTLMTAVWKNHRSVVEMIIPHHDIVKMKDDRQRNIWHHAACATQIVLDDSMISLLSGIPENVVSVSEPDEKGRCPLHSSAIWGTLRVAKKLLQRDKRTVYAREQHDKTPLHFAAAYGHIELAEALLASGSVLEATCHGYSTPLHAACGSGADSVEMVKFLLGKGASIKALTDEKMTPLHTAAAHGQVGVVETLLDHEPGIDVDAVSEGGWTPLHLASGGQQTAYLGLPAEDTQDDPKPSSLKFDFAGTVKLLLSRKAKVKKRSRTLKTALHIAAQYGQVDIVKILLDQSGIEVAARDSAGNTPLLDAASSAQSDEIVPMLAPWTKHGIRSLPIDMKEVAQEFDANITDFQKASGRSRRYRKPVFEALFQGFGEPGEVSGSSLSTKPKDSESFRWIHLPANNLGWCHALLTKHFIEDGASDIEGFRALERSLYHQQYRGRKFHSRHMRPYCAQLPLRHNKSHDALHQPDEEGPDGAQSHDELADSKRTNTLEVPLGDRNELPKVQISRSYTDLETLGFEASDFLTIGKNRARNFGKARNPPGAQDDSTERSRSFPRKEISITSSLSRFRGDLSSQTDFKACLFMPYLEFETKRYVDKMHEHMNNEESRQPEAYAIEPEIAHDRDIRLYKADLAWNFNEYRLHARRTLDQFWYKNINTFFRDSDQVIWRYQNRMREETGDVDINSENFDILMVDQLWIWILGPDLLLTSFPQKLQLPKGDTPALLTSVLEEIFPRAGNPVHSVLELALCIVGQCLSACDHAAIRNGKPSTFDMFNSSIGEAVDKEVNLFGLFKDASKQASQWMTQDQKILQNGIEKKLAEQLLNIEKEINLLEEVKDIKDELQILAHVCHDQRIVLKSVYETFELEYWSDNDHLRQALSTVWRDQKSSLKHHVQEIEIMTQLAEGMRQSLTDLLDHKQKYANSIEARSSRKQADSAAAAGRTILVFTIVTVIFLPLSFLAAFFAIDIAELPWNPQGKLPLPFIMRFVVGVGLGTALTLVIATLAVPFGWQKYKAESKASRDSSDRKKPVDRIQARESHFVRKASASKPFASFLRQREQRIRSYDEEQGT